MSAPSVPSDVLMKAVVSEELRLLYVPVPKAGSTSILWALAGALGLSANDFVRSHKPEVTRALAVHDMTIWGRSHRLGGRSPAELERILRSDEWFRLTVVREPVRRVWSAWVSKLLVRDPRFVAAFGTEDWFPNRLSSSYEVVEWFRRFVRILPSLPGGSVDPHWSAQADAIGLPDIPYGHVGRLERLDETVSVLTDYLADRGRRLPPLGARNESLLPFDPGLLDRATLDACNTWTVRDREAFGYEALSPVKDEPEDAWHAVVDAAMPAIAAVIERHERSADLRAMLLEANAGPQRARRLVRRLLSR